MGFRWATLHWEGGAFSFRRSAFLPDGSQRLPSPGTPQNKIELFSLSELYFNWHDRGRSSAHSPKAREAWELSGRKALEKPSKYLCGPHRLGSLIESRRLMAQCSHCKDETDRYDGGDVPVCVECSDRRKAGRPSSATEQHTHTHAALFHDFLGATARYHEAIGEFEAVMGQLRSGSPDLQRIKNASSNLTILRKQMMMAHHRLHEQPAASVKSGFPDLPNEARNLAGHFHP